MLVTNQVRVLFHLAGGHKRLLTQQSPQPLFLHSQGCGLHGELFQITRGRVGPQANERHSCGHSLAFLHQDLLNDAPFKMVRVLNGTGRHNLALSHSKFSDLGHARPRDAKHHQDTGNKGDVLQKPWYAAILQREREYQLLAAERLFIRTGWCIVLPFK